MRFKQFLLFESKAYLGQRVGDILTALQNLQEDSAGMSARALERSMSKTVDHIRKILHGRWDDSDKKDLKSLQKVGVAMMKAMDETGSDIPSVLASCVAELESLSERIEQPLNNLGSEKSAVDSDREKLLDSDDSSGDLPEELGAE